METYTQRDVDLAWAAGFFDGEGCFYAHKNKPRLDGSCRMIASASVVQKDRSLLLKFQQVTRLGHIGSPNPKGISSWFTSRKGEAANLYNLLRPHLSERRIERIEELLRLEAQQPDIRHETAIQNGLKRRSTCEHGVFLCECLECRRAYNRRWYHAHK